MPSVAQTPVLSVVIPVKDEEPSVVEQLKGTLQSAGWEAIVVDDGSHVPLRCADIRHPHPLGYGISLKHGVARARAPLVATMDGDGQHTVQDVQRLLDYFIYRCHNNAQLYDGPDRVDMVIGDRRIREKSWQRLWGRKSLNWVASCFASRWISDLNSGLRIFRKSIALGYAPILSDGFSYTTTLTLSMLADGYEVDWIPIKVFRRLHGATKVKVWHDGWRTLKAIVWVGGALRTRRLRRLWRALHGRL